MSKTSIFYLLSIFLTCSSVVHGQIENNSLYEAFDKTVGKNNLGLNNGKIHLNNLRQANDTHRYFGVDKYQTGNVIYDHQEYTGISLKYDILNDVVISKVSGENNKIGIDLIREKTAAFYINGKKFVNLNFENPKAPTFVNGFYEDYSEGLKLALYTKFSKAKIEVLASDGVFYKFEQTIRYVVAYQGNYYRISSAKDMIRMLPEQEKNIEDYYGMNASMERTDKPMFMKDLIRYISNFLPTPTN